MLFSELQLIESIGYKVCKGTINVNVPIKSSKHDHKVAKENAQLQAKQDYGDNAQLVLISEICSQLVFTVF